MYIQLAQEHACPIPLFLKYATALWLDDSETQ